MVPRKPLQRPGGTPTEDNLDIKIPWLTVSNAFIRSRNTAPQMFLLSMFNKTSSAKPDNAMAVERLERKQNCLFESKFSESRYRKIPKISPSEYKPPKFITPKNPPLNRPSKYKPPGVLYLETALKIKIKVTHKLLHLPNNYYLCQMIAVENSVSQHIAVCVVHSSVLASISSVHIDKILAWMSFRKIYVLQASFSKNFLKITDVKFPFIYKLAQSFWDANFPAYISSSEYKPFQK